MSEQLKPPKTIYLQWDADPLAEVTWNEDKINNDDICYTRVRNNNARIVELQSQLTKTKAMVERLVEAGDGVHRVATIYRDGDEFDEVAEWERLVAECRASKESDESLLPKLSDLKGMVTFKESVE